jgi:hypothetical protein
MCAGQFHAAKVALTRETTNGKRPHPLE